MVKNGEKGMSRRKMLATTGAATVGAALSAGVKAQEAQVKPPFRPNNLKIKDCAERVRTAVAATKLDMSTRIVTSRDKEAPELKKLLGTSNIPSGFEKWQLPIDLPRAFMFISVAAPHAKVPEHSHEEGDGVRFIASGSVFYQEKELTSGDWMYIPKGQKYSLDVGPMGAMMFYCYQC